ncbi:hypothetical protein AGMMS49975_06570 [Clostridia bacterium]|nr:hypothetical protein AGMMS49975_06570 [Clostridia bacterium]
MNAYKILEETLNLKDIRIYDTVPKPEGGETRVLNRKETTLAAQKQDAIKEAFSDWIFKDPQRRDALVTKYNELFNSTRPREYDGSHIEFVGINPEIKLRPHQLDAIAHILYGGNTLLAHEVGAGKTFEMVAAAMESKRLGLCQKSLFVVPNHIIEQMAADFLRLYPAANILVATKKDFETENRKKFCGRIATGEYDAIIIGHSQFEKIPLSSERQKDLIQDQISEITDGIRSIKSANGERFTIKQLEKTKRSLENRLEKLSAENRKDSVVTFEQLGVDRLFVDEAHNYKNLFLATKMRNVAGISTTEAQKSSDLYMKCRYMDEITGSKGNIFATGTPLSNSMTELYTMMRYLQYDTLNNHNLLHFDSWASTFGETTTAIELAPEGTGYRAKTRFNQFFNLPELMNMFKEAADIKTADTLNLTIPEAKYETIKTKPSEIQKKMVEELSERATAVHKKKVDPTQDNMLRITNDGRKIGLDPRMMNSLLADDPNSKVNVCINNIFKIYEESKPKKSAQIVFCDLSTPTKDGSFNVYDDIKKKLISKGVKPKEVAFIHEADTEIKKKELFAKVRKGQVRVLIGSTAKCGAGTNVQDKLIALHDLDAPWRPSDLEQRRGRIVRQGNENKEVQIYRYVTEGTFDAYLYQTLENKQKFISQIMTSKNPVRRCDDMDEAALSFAEIKALCADNPNIAEKMKLDVEVSKLKILKANHQSQIYDLEDKLLKTFPKQIKYAEEKIANITADMSELKKTETDNQTNKDTIPPMIINGVTYTDKKEAGTALLAVCGEKEDVSVEHIGSYRGLEMSLGLSMGEFFLNLDGNSSYQLKLGDDVFGNLSRINHALENIPNILRNTEEQLENLHQQVEHAKVEVTKSFPTEQELTEKSSRLKELDTLLNIDNSNSDEPKQPQKEEQGKPKSSLDKLLSSAKEKADAYNSAMKNEKTADIQTPNIKPDKEQ